MKYQTALPDNKVQCNVCPRNCVLEEGQGGFCHVRKNINGQVTLTTYGYNTGLTIDPIEKKPLYQFYPGSNILSFGTLGCNLGCKFCQNWHFSRSKEDPEAFNKASPEEIVEEAIKRGCKSIAYTYNDPVIFVEYMRDTAKIARQKGLKNVAVTSGYINPQLHYDFFEYLDGVNIDLKSFSEDFYKKYSLSHLEPVLKTIKYVKQHTDVWMELTTLLINELNDSEEETRKECEWIKENIGVHVPLHFSAFFPAYKLKDKPLTDPKTLLRAYNIALETGLKYVYAGNISGAIASSTTYCEKCSSAMIVRSSYHILEYNLDNEGKCIFCGHPCHGRFD